MRDVLLVLLASASPISELRGGIPLGVALGLDIAPTFLLAVGVGASVHLLAIFFQRLGRGASRVT